MANTNQEFFEEIAARGSDPALRDITGTCRFEIVSPPLRVDSAW